MGEQMVLLGTEHRGHGAGVPGPEGWLESQNSLTGTLCTVMQQRKARTEKAGPSCYIRNFDLYLNSKGRTMTCFKEGMDMIKVRFYQNPSGYHGETRL